MKVTIISASTRILRRSHSVALFLKNQIELRGHFAEILDLAAYQFPVFDEVLAKQPDPSPALLEFSHKIRHSDAVLFISPEYNGSYTSALKNAVDYLKDQEFAQKVIGSVSVSAGMLGGIRAALNMQELALAVGGFVLPQMLLVSEVGKRFSETGGLLDQGFQPKVDVFLDAFLWISEAVVEKKHRTEVHFSAKTA